MSVTVATTAEVLQFLGRAGRNVNDDRPVEAKVLISKDRLKDEIRNVFISADPTQLILKSAGAYNAIKKNKLFSGGEYKDYAPQTFVDYLSVLDTSAETSREFKIRLERSVNKLIHLGALDSENNLTEFGQFLIQTGFNTDYGIMIYESFGTSNFEEVIAFTTLLESEMYLCLPGKNKDYIKYRDKLTHFKSEFYSEFDGKVSDLDFSYWLINTLRNSPKEDLKNCERKLIDAYKNDTIGELGINIQTIDKILKSSDEKIDKLENDYSQVINANEGEVGVKGSDIIPTKEMKRLALSGFSASLCQCTSGYKFEHLGLSDKEIVISNSSIPLKQKDQFFVAGNFNPDPNCSLIYASGICPISLEDLLDPELMKYASFKITILDEVQNFDMQTGIGNIIQKVFYQNLTTDEPRVIGNIKKEIAQESPERHKIFVQTFLKDCSKFISQHSDNLAKIKEYNQLAQLAQVTELDQSIGEIPEESLVKFYQKQVVKFPEICSLDDLQLKIDSGEVDFVFNPFNKLNQDQLDNLELVKDEYPSIINAVEVLYETNNNDLIEPIILIGNSDKFIEYYKANKISLVVRELQAKDKIGEIKIQYANKNISLEELESIKSEIELKAKYALLEKAKKNGNLMSHGDFTDIKTTEGLEKIGSIVIGQNPFDDSDVLAYPFAEYSYNYYLGWSIHRPDIDFKVCSVYTDNLNRINSEATQKALSLEFNSKLPSIIAKYDLLVMRLGENYSGIELARDQVGRLEYYVQNGTYANATGNARAELLKVEKTLQELESLKFYGDSAFDELSRFSNMELLEVFKSSYDQSEITKSFNLYPVLVGRINSDSGELIANVYITKDSNNENKASLTLERKVTQAFFNSLEVIQEANIIREFDPEEEHNENIESGEIMEMSFDSKRRAKVAKGLCEKLKNSTFSLADIQQVRNLILSNHIYSLDYLNGDFKFFLSQYENGRNYNEITLYQVDHGSKIIPQDGLIYDTSLDNTKEEVFVQNSNGSYIIRLITGCEILEPLPEGHKQVLENYDTSQLPSNSILDAFANKFSKKK